MLRSSCCALALLSLGAGAAWADDEGLGDKVFSAEMVRIADVLDVPSDALARGQVSVHRKFGAVIALWGAPASTTYDVAFCHALPALACASLGSLTTPPEGEVRQRFEFASSGKAFLGWFQLSRGGQVHFVSGFHLAGAEEVAAVEVKLTGRIESLGTNSLRLKTLPVDILVGPDTRFEGVETFAGLAVDMLVKIEGATQPDGKILASKIEREGSEDDKKPHPNEDKEDKHGKP